MFTGKKSSVVSFVLITVLCVNAFAFTQYSVNLRNYDKNVYEELCELFKEEIRPADASVYVFENIKEFCGITGAPYWIKGFTNHSGIYIQAKSLLGEAYSETLLHELLHWTVKMNFTLPEWYEEGVVCIITGETDGVKSVPAMENPESFDTGSARNDWELLSYELGCVEKVRKIIKGVKY